MYESGNKLTERNQQKDRHRAGKDLMQPLDGKALMALKSLNKRRFKKKINTTDATYQMKKTKGSTKKFLALNLNSY